MRYLTIRALSAGLTALLLSVFASGCSNKDKPYKVQGKVMFNGKPMAGGGSISFVPLGKQEGKTGGGEIDANGNYTLTTHKSGDGSMAGEFRVVIIQQTEQEGENRGDGELRSGSKSTVAKADRIPEVYGDHSKSPLRAKVEAKDLNVIDFTLEANPAPAALRDLLFGERFASVEPFLFPGHPLDFSR